MSNNRAEAIATIPKLDLPGTVSPYKAHSCNPLQLAFQAGYNFIYYVHGMVHIRLRV
jgi:hypothetical protein